MSRPNDIRENVNPHALRAALFATIALLIAADLFTDYQEGASLVHIASELVVLLLAMVGAALGWRRLRQVSAERARLDADLARTRAEAQRWRQENEELVLGLSQAIERQLAQWGLSEAESEVALLLLKGLSLQEIAGLRGTSERTVREQARAVYRKSGLSGRATLSAYFLEDLLLGRADAG